jgi:hypothetical protein
MHGLIVNAKQARRACAKAHHLALMRDQGHLVFTLKDAQGEPMTAGQALLTGRPFGQLAAGNWRLAGPLGLGPRKNTDGFSADL